MQRSALSFPVMETAPTLNTISASDLLARDWPPRENLLSPWLPRRGLTMLYGLRGLGKTHFALGIAAAIAGGGRFLRWEAPQPASVLYVDGEMPAGMLKDWFSEALNGADGAIDAASRITFLTSDLQERGIPDLSSMVGQRAVEEQLDGIDLLILDNKSTLCRAGDDNAAGDWQPVQEWLLSLRSAGKSVLMLHHAGKNGSARGTSLIEVPLDTVIALKKPLEYDPADGLCCEVHFEKARAIFGNDVEPFEARYRVESGAARWTTRALEDLHLSQVAQLANDGLKQREIARALNLSVGKVNRLMKEARSAGLITRG